jgi:uncharacterized protein (DUF1499 family)
VFKFRGKRPTHLGVTHGRLAPPPRKPNCVSSQADPADAVHHIAPLAPEGDAAAAMRKLRAVVEGMARSGRAIHVRSASWLGYSDLGVNRKRVEEIRSALRSATAQACSGLRPSG